ncbi:uncharacterized protein Dwil_GK25322 [Drosophila willistoni]|uniref:Uncharacterized protein n=2 Tax=Drosophila willistoni TaxID=7260 RepID=B4NEC3_DROWI|nr:uncharacterized protein Dwil_GK25322 [Drosophila willistoni]
MTGNALAAAIPERHQYHPLQLRIAECRQLCYRQTAVDTTLCRTWPDCFMCHDYCRVLALAESTSLAISMCSDPVFCTHGCRIACSYHRLSGTPKTNEISSNAVSKDLTD